jgi:hypothetical protein
MALVHAEKTRKSNSQPSLSRGGGGNTLFFQPKLNIGKPHDQYEAEADKVADQVVSKSPLTDQPFFAPSASPPVRSIHTAPVQKNPVAESSTPLSQKEGAEDEMLQMQPLSEEESMLQAKSDSTPQVPADFESGLNRSKGGGSPLSPGVKNQMESGFDTDFSNVRIHTDSGAEQMSRQISAQAFTHGNDIYFNEGKYNPASKSGQHLIAHELTHTVQQATSVQPKMIQKIDEPATPISIDEVTNQHPNSKGRIEKSGNTVTIFLNGLRVKQNAPLGILNNFSLPHLLPGAGSRSESPTQQATIWSQAVRADTELSLENLLANIEAGRPMAEKKAPDKLYKLTLKRGSRQAALTGNFTQLKNAAIIPSWNRRGQTTTFQVEHVLDYQIAGNQADNIDNLILLESSTNNYLGDIMRTYIRNHINDVLTHYNRYIAADELVNSADAARQNENYIIKANSFSTVVHEFMADRAYFKIDYSPNMPGNPLNSNLVELESLTVPPGHFILKTSQTSAGLLLPYSAQNLEVGSLLLTLMGNEQVGLSSITAVPVIDGNHLEGEITPETYSVTRAAGTHTYTADTTFGRRQLMRGLRLRYLSLMEFSEPQLDDSLNIRAEGRINTPSPGFLNNTPIEISITGKTLSIQKTFSANDLASIGPFSIDYASLTLGLNTDDGLTASGSVGFSIAGIGSGTVNASATEGNFTLNGNFGFESNNIDGNLEMQYSSISDRQVADSIGQSAWSIEGTLNLREITGVKKATIGVAYENQIITGRASNVELTIPGITVNQIALSYGLDSDKFEFIVDAGTSRIPGIRSAEITVTISSGENGEAGGYRVNVSGTAQPDIPGIDSTLTVSYDNGTLTIEGSAAYNRGMLAGTVNIGATNRPIGEDGAPAGDPDDTMRVYGGGSLTLTLTPWLQATAGVQFLPNGEIEVTGRIGLPDTVDVFDRKSIERNLFTAPAVEIPIFAIPLGPRSIGIVARITGGLDFSAGFGPGQLRSLYADVTYNPDREDETTISGHGEFVIPADAGLTLRGDLGLGVSVGIASLTGGIEVTGELGLEGEAAAAVDVNWSPLTGLALDATGRITVNPKFSFGINAFARASLDLWLVSFSETWRYNLVAFSWGPDIQFGIIFPVHYREGEPFDMSFDDIEVIYPDLDIIEMAKGLARDIKDNIFD